ncbi:(2S)-3-sulfopropanediol dehydratase [Clostridium cylindrosporum]|uniref:Putative formate acetyltransferase 3 n=1 Tax=Clostridium cylindrosporum DSM 605 TaxID=1121307 RepID=A0A0J8G230_CLOCY|nr:pyruvate formate lyase family protein [Clostridium cylindrosporum]KMT21811.1 putative formate acetyltransferase 3 [Clostridium cylindrosporum DSM 605]
MVTTVLSPQEIRIESEISNKLNFIKKSRAEKILDSFKGERPRIDAYRAKYFTESFKETEGEALILRWAKALKRYAEKAPVYIDKDQLIVGRSGYPGRYGLVYPELDGDFLDIAIKELPKRETSPFNISKEDARILIEEVAPYWKGKTFHEDLAKALSDETIKYTYNPNNTLESRFIVNETASFRSSIQWVHDYEKVLKLGYIEIRNQALKALEELDPFSPVDNTEKAPFLNAIVIVSDAIILWARRHGDLALELSKRENDSIRRDELKVIASNCYRVPAYPAESFYEAVQSQWFVQMFSRIEQKTGTVISNGRMDQYLYPYYKKDVESGVLTDEGAIELLDCVWVAMAQFIDLYISPTGGAFNEGYAHWEAVTIGGQTKEGVDATNDLTYLFLESKKNFPLNYPDLAARIHTRSPIRYLYEVAETIKDGSGFPKLINDEEVVPLLLSKGASFDEAYDYAVSGCAECRMPNRDTYTSPCAYINFAAALEMTLYNGKMQKYGDEVIGLETGDPREFKSFDEFFDAYLKQQKNFLKHAFIQQHEIIRLREQHFAAPLSSSMHRLCLENYKDIHSAHIEGGIDLGYFEFIGYGTVIDSLSAVKKLVFEHKKITIDELLEATQNNFEGYEAIRQQLLSAPSYGNNDEYADSIAKKLDYEALKFTEKYSKELGVNLDLRYVPFTSHVPFGKVVSATPNGRFSFTPLADGSSASHGADVNGPTAVLLSNFESKNYGIKNRAARLLNIKLTPSCVDGDEGTDRLVDLIRTWCDLKLWHLQFNIINKETLIEAKKNPEDYSNLLVRVAGYSAYFVELSEDLQDDIIARTEHRAI